MQHGSRKCSHLRKVIKKLRGSKFPKQMFLKDSRTSPLLNQNFQKGGGLTSEIYIFSMDMVNIFSRAGLVESWLTLTQG